MKKAFFLLITLIFCISAANAQFTKLGGGLTYTTGYHYNNENTGSFADLHRSPFLGIYAKGIYEITLPIHVSPSFTFFIPRHNTSAIQTAGEETRVSSMMFDINGHYVFNSLKKFEFYGLAGLDILFARIKWIGTSSHDNGTALGLNLGGGAYYKLTEQMDLNLEAKYIISKYPQFMINAGVLLNLQWLAKNENPDL
jgi:opacity protein-like surface antigen